MFDFRPNECDKHMQTFESVLLFFNDFCVTIFPEKQKVKEIDKVGIKTTFY
jgi:hypothetical protein